MFSSLWNYLRRKTAESILAGAQDAVAALESADKPAPLALPEAIRERLSLAAPGNGKAEKAGRAVRS